VVCEAEGSFGLHPAKVKVKVKVIHLYPDPVLSLHWSFLESLEVDYFFVALSCFKLANIDPLRTRFGNGLYSWTAFWIKIGNLSTSGSLLRNKFV
jgi:hypothetical protein